MKTYQTINTIQSFSSKCHQQRIHTMLTLSSTVFHTHTIFIWKPILL